jgi:hypothetical protein
MTDATGRAEALLGLDGLRILPVAETPAEVVVSAETTAELLGCAHWGIRATPRIDVVCDIRDLPCFGRPARPV